MSTRSLATIAREIRREWKPVNYAAVPYLDAMAQLDDLNEMYMADSAVTIVNYFLSNAAHWRGEKAKAIKAELKLMLKEHGSVKA